MAERADAHIHLFERSYEYHASFTMRSGVQIDEAACYESLMGDHDVTAALIVAYMGEPCYAGNNEYLARIKPQHDWMHPVAYVEPTEPPTIAQLEQWQSQGFVGLSMYIFGDKKTAALQRVGDEVWSWLTTHRWLISVNSKGDDILAWLPVLERHGDLRVVISHLGLPPKVSQPPDAATAKRNMAKVTELAAFDQTRVKLSGFYAVTEPRYEYPHTAAWPYVEALLGAFGAERLLWASDFSPCLDSLTFPQTYGLFTAMPFLTDTDRECIEGGNLLALLGEAQ